MSGDQRSNTQLGLSLAVAAIVLSSFLAALMGARAGEIAAALATVISGSFVLAGAAIAWQSVQQQIKSQEKIEAAKRVAEVEALERGFTSELLVYSRGLVQALSIWNQRARSSPAAEVRTNWPVYIDPLYYKTNIGKIGLVRHNWVIGTLITFYSNLLELNDQAREAMAGRPTAHVTSQSIASRLSLMATSMSMALDGLNDDQKFPIPRELAVAADQTFMPNGETVSQAQHVPKNLQDVLLRVAGN